MKETIKQIIKKIPIAFTKNQQYDKQTKQVIREVCDYRSCCVDVGAHKGEVLDIMLNYAFEGMHYAFEPIPDMFKELEKKYANSRRVKLFEYALSKETGTTSFNYVISNPSYSGLIKRKYDREDEEDTEIEVKTELLDNVLPPDCHPNLIKIDVEGGELLVLEGAQETIKKSKPVIIFEHGLGASDYYDSTPEKVFALLTSCGLRISTMEKWLKRRPCLTEEQFKEHYYKQHDYYFIAYP